jgi:hypothetical protein
MLQGQMPAPAAPGNGAGGPASTATPARALKFQSDLLDLGFNYPAGMSAQELPDLQAQHAAIARQRPNATADDRKTDACTDKALVATREGDGSPGGDGATHAITGKILISRIGVDCMPASYRDQIENVATAMSTALAQDRDLHPIDRPIWYPIGNTHIHFAAGKTAADNLEQAGAKDAKPARWVGSAAFVWSGNLVSIVIESNDLKFFNEMLHSTIALGKGAPGTALFPAEIGSGKPIELKQ